MDIAAEPNIHQYNQNFTIAGTYVSRETDRIYCPYPIAVAAYRSLYSGIV